MAIWTLARFLRLTAVPRLSPIFLRIAAASPYFAMAWGYSPRRWWATPIALSTSPCPCSLPSWAMSARAWTRGSVTALRASPAWIMLLPSRYQARASPLSRAVRRVSVSTALAEQRGGVVRVRGDRPLEGGGGFDGVADEEPFSPLAVGPRRLEGGGLRLGREGPRGRSGSQLGPQALTQGPHQAEQAAHVRR